MTKPLRDKLAILARCLRWGVAGLVLVGPAVLVAVYARHGDRTSSSTSAPDDVPVAASSGGAPSVEPAIPRSPECAALPECRSAGRCMWKDEKCVALHDEHCAASDECGTAGRCGVKDGRCAPRTDLHCANSEACLHAGKCAVQDTLCVPKTEEHCRRSEGCRLEGRCRLLVDEVHARCGIETHEDCESSHLCREQRHCHMAPLGVPEEGRCIRAELVRRQRFPLRAARHGINGELAVLVDSRLLPKKTRGYTPDPEDPRAASAIELRGSDGVVRRSLTLHPDVTVAVENLGAGTDTFLATEHVGCPEQGHWCGWTTRFFEVRGGELSTLAAVGARGEQRPMVATASVGSRWRLVPGSKRGMKDLLVQIESLVPPGPALVETRFTFSRGRFRFTERRWPEFLPSVSKQPGPWNGKLELHEE